MTRNLVAAAIAAVLATGCEATFRPAETIGFAYEGGMAVPAETVPADIYAYPRAYFHGGYAYLVGGLWYTWTPSGWVIFRREPVELSRQRTRSRYPAPSYPYPAYPYER